MKLLPHSELGSSNILDHGASVRKILDGTLRAIQNVGTRRLSMSDISEASGVSRGTLYRYFESKEDVLAAVSEHICASFEHGIAEAASGSDDPLERFRLVMRFYSRFTIERAPERLFEVEPAFHLNFLRTHFTRHKAAVLGALEQSIVYFEELIGQRIHHDAFVDVLVRLQLSTLIVPAEDAWVNRWNESPDHLLKWALKISGQAAKSKERMN